VASTGASPDHGCVGPPDAANLAGVPRGRAGRVSGTEGEAPPLRRYGAPLEAGQRAERRRGRAFREPDPGLRERRRSVVPGTSFRSEGLPGDAALEDNRWWRELDSSAWDVRRSVVRRRHRCRFVTADLRSDREGASVLRRSTDGGATWRTIFREPKRGVFRVHFADIRHGFLVEDEGRNLPYFGYTLLASTADGGRTWRRHGIPADLPVAFYGRDIWVGHDLSGVSWHTADGGETWRLTTSARFLDPGGPDLIEPHGLVNCAVARRRECDRGEVLETRGGGLRTRLGRGRPRAPCCVRDS
jgi:hypothetical protein